MATSKTARWAGIAFLVLLANSAYILAFATPSVFYMANVLAHIGLGALWAVLLFLDRKLRKQALIALAVIATGAALVYTGAGFDFRWLLWLHIAAGVLTALALVIAARRREWALVLAACCLFYFTVAAYQRINPDHQTAIVNPLTVPASMQQEGAGPRSPFWPSSANTNVNGIIPSNFFMDSKLCGECHKDAYAQWNSSMHHFSSFNNRFYARSIEHMQEISGTQGSKWCAGCHDHAVFFNGRFEKPIQDQINTPEAQNGLGCVSCHSIVHVDSTMGNGDFTIEYPRLHELASSRNPYIRALDRFLTKVAPEPHRRTFLKPFMKDSSEFCSTCHKVHLDGPVNNYRWIRGFNEYDNWQGSGVSGQGARSFYYPDKPLTCGGCHMPLVPSKDPGNREGMVHDHRFAAANTAVAHVNGDAKQLAATKGFLQSGFISVDIFSAAPADTPPQSSMLRRAESAPQAMTTFAVGEESDAAAGAYTVREIGKLAAPLDRTEAEFVPGSTIRLDVVVRTRKIGHFFPGGTVDAYDVWLELEGRDATGKTVYHSGAVADGGRGPVEPGAHFYRSLMLDGDGNPVNKRNAWQTRSLLYIRLIPPGAADVAHYRIAIPKDAKGPLTFTARLNYRKFAHYYTQFSFGLRPAPAQDPKLVSIHYDSREYQRTPGASIPDPPTVTLAHAKVELRLGNTTVWKAEPARADRERWNDWGIGMLLQGDLKGAEYAFTKVTEAQSDYADGWLNVARALIQEGEIERAREFIAKALELNPALARAHFFKAMAEKTDGNYDASLSSLRLVAQQYPRDRVVQNQIGRVLFLKRDFKAAAAAFQQVLAIDPEDVQAHYNLMLAFRGLGDAGGSAREEALFRRFKADESAQTLTAKIRRTNPEDNNERQPIHEHESVRLK